MERAQLRLRDPDADGHHTLDHAGWGQSASHGAVTSAERARTDRSCCRQCGAPIAKGAVRLGRPEKKRGKDITGWWHVQCVDEGCLPPPKDDVWAERVDGWSALDEDAKRICLRASGGQ